jgi:hypothetical protein
MLIIMSRCYTSSVVHSVINIQDETLSSCITTLAPTLCDSHWKQLQRRGGTFFHTPPIALAPSDYHIFGFVKDQLHGKHFETGEAISKQCVSVFGWPERNLAEGEFSNSQNTGRNVYKEVVIMWKNEERSVD